MSTASNGPSMKLQIVVNKKKNRVLFAEANKDFVDFIVHILSFPLGAVQRILAKYTSTSLGSIGTLQEGFINLDEKYTEDPAQYYITDHLKAPYWGTKTPLLLPDASWNKATRFRKHDKRDSDKKDSIYVELAHYSLGFYNGEFKVVGSNIDTVLVRGSDKGYVKETAMYMVMDDLEVRPADPTSLISLMSQHGIKDVRDIEKWVVDFGTDEAAKLLKASVTSKTVLTNVFLRGAVVVKEEH